MPIKMSDYLKTQTYIKAFIKGMPGAGKTYLSASISKLMKTLYIDIEGGIQSAKSVIDPNNLDVEVVRDADNNTFFQHINFACDLAEREEYKCVVIDSISEISQRIEDDYANKDGVVELRDWQKVIQRVQGFARLLRDMSKHVIITCIVKPPTESKTLQFEPYLAGKLSTLVPSMFHLVGLVQRNVDAKGKHYFLTTFGPSSYGVRDRNNILQDDEIIPQKEPHLIWQKYLDKLYQIQQPQTKETVKLEVK